MAQREIAEGTELPLGPARNSQGEGARSLEAPPGRSCWKDTLPCPALPLCGNPACRTWASSTGTGSLYLVVHSSSDGTELVLGGDSVKFLQGLQEIMEALKEKGEDEWVKATEATWEGRNPARLWHGEPLTPAPRENPKAPAQGFLLTWVVLFLPEQPRKPHSSPAAPLPSRRAPRHLVALTRTPQPHQTPRDASPLSPARHLGPPGTAAGARRPASTRRPGAAHHGGRQPS